MWKIENLVKHEGMPAEEYHSLNGCSSTLIKKVWSSGVLQASWEQKKPKKATPAMQRGTLFHDLILEGVKIKHPRDTHSVYDGIKRGKKWDQHVVDAEAQGLIPCSKKEHEDLVKDYKDQGAILKAIHPDAVVALSQTTHREVSFTFDWVCSHTEYRIPGKARLDAWNEKTGQIDDLKTMNETPTPRNMKSAMSKYFYHIQAAVYTRVSEAACGHGQVPCFNWIFITNFEPYDSGYVECDYDSYVSGVQQLNYALNSIKAHKEGEYSSAAPRNKVVIGVSKYATMELEAV